MKTYDHIVSFVCNEPWAIMPEKLEAILDLLRLRMQGITFSAEDLKARIGAPREEGKPEIGPLIAVLPLRGVISHRANMLAESSGGISTERFGYWLETAVNEPSVEAIVLDVDSPGGRIAGLAELHSQIMAARKTKKVVAVANSLMASAAYWISSAADEVVATPSAFVGSIGVIMPHISSSEALEKAGYKVEIISAGKYKAEANPYQPLDEEARARLQTMADRAYTYFVADVAKGRGVTSATVRKEYGEGRVLDAREAFDAGLVDSIDTMAATVQRLGASITGKRTKPPARAETVIDPAVARAQYENRMRRRFRV